MKKISIIGSGSWGTAIAKLLYENGHKVTMWSFSKEQSDIINKEHENKEFLPSVLIPTDLKVTHIDKDAIGDSEIIVLAVPSKFVRETIKRFKPFLSEKNIIVNISKGLEDNTLYRLSQVIEEEVPMCKVVVLSGPSHAEEVSKNIPTACVSTSKDLETAEYIQDIFMNQYFRVYTSVDIIGVELGGALKNVIALSAGISEGLGFGDNTKAALMTRGLTEICRLGVAMGADMITFNGLTGVGDLIVTCTSMHSRNRRAGILIGKGRTLQEALDEVHMVVEGVCTAKAAYDLSIKYNVQMPITKEIYGVLFEGKDAKLAVTNLMNREKTSEHAKEDIARFI